MASKDAIADDYAESKRPSIHLEKIIDRMA
jgi:hypothetical protein